MARWRRSLGLFYLCAAGVVGLSWQAAVTHGDPKLVARGGSLITVLSLLMSAWQIGMDRRIAAAEVQSSRLVEHAVLDREANDALGEMAADAIQGDVARWGDRVRQGILVNYIAVAAFGELWSATGDLVFVWTMRS